LAEQKLKLDEIYDKLAKLKALEERAGTPHEAEQAAAAATRLIARFNLDEAALRQKLGKKAQPLSFVEQKLDGIKFSWQRSLLYVCATHNQCMSLSFVGTKTASVFGPATAVPLVVTLYRSLEKTVEHLTRQGFLAERHIYTTPKLWKTSYRLGCVSGINQALKAAFEVAVEQTENGSALVLVTQEQLQQEFTNTFGKTRTLATPDFDQAAYASGYRDGRNVNVASRGDLEGGN